MDSSSWSICIGHTIIFLRFIRLLRLKLMKFLALRFILLSSCLKNIIPNQQHPREIPYCVKWVEEDQAYVGLT